MELPGTGPPKITESEALDSVVYLTLGAVLVQASKGVEVSGVQLGGVLEANQGTAHVVAHPVKEETVITMLLSQDNRLIS